MIKTILTFLNLTCVLYSQQQTDIRWPTLANTDWPMIKHDPQFTGRSPYKGPQTPTIIWTRDMENGIFSGPVIGMYGNLYFGSYYVFGDYFYSYSQNGDFLWEYETGSGRATQSGILIDSSNTIYFGSRDSCFYALNSDGTFKWKYKTSASIDQEVIPNIDLQGNIYITNSKGILYSFKQDGTLNWNVSYATGFASRSPAFSPDGSTIYIAGFDSNLFALNLNGTVKWEFSCGQIMRAPIVDSDGHLFFTGGDSLYSVSSDGSLNWNYFTFGTSHSIPAIDKRGNIYSIAWDTTCCPYYPELISLTHTGHLNWNYIFNDIESDDFWQPLICDSIGTIYIGSTFGYNYYAISNNGELKWKISLNVDHQQVDNTGAISKDGTLFLGVHDVSLFGSQIQTLIAIKDTDAVFVDEEIFEIKDYSLSQNHPNPFNPSTTVNYQLPNSGFVTLKVYDILGREVATLVNEEKSQGRYSVNFSAKGGSASGGDALNLASGVYIYQIRVNDYVSSKKMMLLK